MPGVVALGEKPDLYACAYCHLPNGQGRPENASLAVLPAEYIEQQVADFKSGLRKSSEPRHLPSANMVRVAKQASAEQVRRAARYFAGLKPRPWIRVVESATVPKAHVAGWMLVASEGGQTEPIDERILEMPEDLDRTELRDDRSGFVAYVPVGSIDEGKKLASGVGVSKKVACSQCHGDDLRGHEDVPALAGRSPSYLVRQLNDMQNGNRKGAAVGLMKPVVKNLTVKDMVALAAYCASLKP
jgi:cytochrome c553